MQHHTVLSVQLLKMADPLLETDLLTTQLDGTPHRPTLPPWSDHEVEAALALEPADLEIFCKNYPEFRACASAAWGRSTLSPWAKLGHLPEFGIPTVPL